MSRRSACKWIIFCNFLESIFFCSVIAIKSDHAILNPLKIKTNHIGLDIMFHFEKGSLISKRFSWHKRKWYVPVNILSLGQNKNKTFERNVVMFVRFSINTGNSMYEKSGSKLEILMHGHFYSLQFTLKQIRQRWKITYLLLIRFQLFQMQFWTFLLNLFLNQIP